MCKKLIYWNFIAGLALSALSLSAQTPVPRDWFTKDPEIDKVQGVSADRVYETLLKDQPSRPVLVAIIDSGVDIDHEDLKDLIWVNPKEIAGNGLDDDKNGYVDDIHGWNFIGGKDGNVEIDNLEMTREYVRLKKKFENMNRGDVPKRQKAEFDDFQKLATKFEKLKEKNAQQYYDYSKIYINVNRCVDTLKSIMKVDTLTQENVTAFVATTEELAFAKGLLLKIMKNFEGTISEMVAELKEGYEHFRVTSEFSYNEDYDSRAIVGDHYDDTYEKGYGNNDVKGPEARHGTHVAGIIGANRKNDIGMKGIADNVRIMSVRTVPNGDERDKDVANAILYAVDNGAQVINMSFGKSLSPQKEAVDRAVKHAESKGVLIIHAAGNDGDDNDVEPNYPNPLYLNGKEAKNWIEVGASSWGTGPDFVADFSNYGKKTVDVFAPGVKIYSTVPESHYEDLQGTSMSAPVVTGIAAMLMSYFPDLTAAQVKDIITKSARRFDGLQVQRPGGTGKVQFSELSKSGGLVNAYEAVKLALQPAGAALVK